MIMIMTMITTNIENLITLRLGLRQKGVIITIDYDCNFNWTQVWLWFTSTAPHNNTTDYFISHWTTY